MASDVALQPDGRIVTAGFVSSSSGFAGAPFVVARYLS